MNVPVTGMPPIHQSHAFAQVILSLFWKGCQSPQERALPGLAALGLVLLRLGTLVGAKQNVKLMLSTATPHNSMARPGLSRLIMALGCPTLSIYWCNLARLQAWQH
jgi:hypothetical protein